MGHKTSFDQAQRNYDHMEPPCDNTADREEWAGEQIIDAMNGTTEEKEEMLEKLGISMEEYMEEYCGQPESLAEAYQAEYLEMLDKEAEEYNISLMVD